MYALGTDLGCNNLSSPQELNSLIPEIFSANNFRNFLGDMWAVKYTERANVTLSSNQMFLRPTNRLFMQQPQNVQAISAERNKLGIPESMCRDEFLL